MLRKRTRSVQKEHEMCYQPILSDSSGCDSHSHPQSKDVSFNHKSKPLFNIPSPFVGLSFKALSDSDSVRSPTSPLEFRVFSNLGNPCRSPITSANDGGNQKNWNCCKVGLGIVDSLDDDVKVSGKIIRSSESKNIIFGPRRIKTPLQHSHVDSIEASRSLPKKFAILPQPQIKSPLQNGNSEIFKNEDTSLEPLHEPLRSYPSDSLCNYGGYEPSSGSGNICAETVTSQVMNSPSALISESENLKGSMDTQLNAVPGSMVSSNDFNISLSENELSEDYTCVISHGPNLKTTHIFCDCILECHANHPSNHTEKEEKETALPQAVTSSVIEVPYFLNYCHFCNKKLEDGKDIYIYRGDRAFCSLICRAQEIVIDEESEKSENRIENSPKPDKGRKLFESGVFVMY